MKITIFEETTIELELNSDDIISMLQECGKLPRLIKGNGITVFDVPIGGDYSGSRLTIDNYSPIKITYIGQSKKHD